MPSPSQKISLQINLSPGDYPLAKYILPHQLNTLAGQVDEIILVVESKASKGRFADGWIENESKLAALLDNISNRFQVKIIKVDYATEQKKKIAEHFFGLQDLPEKDFRGGPFYGYFFGLYHCSHQLVFHLDADIFLGGNSQTWIQEAINLFNTQQHLLTVSPLPGPPTADESLRSQHILHKFKDLPYQYELAGFSTRIFIIDQSLLYRFKLKFKKPGLKNQLKALLTGNSNADLPEHFISNLMLKKGLKRIDFLGSAPGLWSLHPPFRTPEFYSGLPELIQKIEQNQLPPAQAGFYDIIDEVVDWTVPRNHLKTNRWWKLKNINDRH